MMIVCFTLFFFAFVMPVAYHLRKEIDKEIIFRVEKEFGESFNRREEALAFSLVKIFNIASNKFWDFAGDLKKAREHYFSLDNPIIGTNYFRFIYDPDSKSRIYTLLLAILAIIAARSLYHDNPTNLSDIFFWFLSDFSKTFKLWITFSISIGIIIFSAYFVILFLLILFTEINFRFLLTKYSRSRYAIKHMERLFLNLHNTPTDKLKQK